MAAMEDVLEVYGRSYDARYPVVRMDEKPYQPLEDMREPLSGWRYTEALQRRTKKYRARKIQWPVDTRYSAAEKVVLVMDNPNTHTISSLYETFPPTEAFQLAGKLETYFTPRHGSWLDIAEVELPALAVQCLGTRRIGDIKTLNARLSAWHTRRNRKQKGVDWQFTKFL